MNLDPRLQQKLEAIAKQHLLVETLETRRMDSLDFPECAVWGIRDALEAAYRLGFENGRKASTRTTH